MQPQVLEEMSRQAEVRSISPVGYNGFIVFDEMTIQVRHLVNYAYVHNKLKVRVKWVVS